MTLFGDDPTLGQPTYTVAGLARAITDVVQAGLPGDLWIEGEVRDISRSPAGHVYFNLIDPVPAGQMPDALISVVLWKSTKEVVNRLLKKHGGVRIDDGVQLRIRGTVDFYPPQGRLQVRMTGIDPEYTLGQLEAERERLLRALAAEDLLDANAAVALPPVPLAVGLVTSAGSAAATDFLHELELSRIAWNVRVVDTRVQGAEAPLAIVRAIEIASRRSDVVVLVRGGGARTDLVAFDNELVARAIATCRRPVLTGIGHEVDRSVADEVAHSSFKTPTACAGALVAQVRAFDEALVATWGAVAATASRVIGRHELVLRTAASRSVASSRAALRLGEARLDAATGRIARRPPRTLRRADRRLLDAATAVSGAARRAPDAARARLLGLGRRLSSSSARDLTVQGRHFDAIEARVAAVDPGKALARGWSITRRADGRIVRSTADVDPGDATVTTVGDGTIHGRVTSTEPAGPNDQGAS